MPARRPRKLPGLPSAQELAGRIEAAAGIEDRCPTALDDLGNMPMGFAVRSRLADGGHLDARIEWTNLMSAADAPTISLYSPGRIRHSLASTS